MTYKIRGKKRLCGSILVQGSKNAALPIIGASLLVKGCVVLHNCPKILDVYTMLSILKRLGCQVRWEADTVIIHTQGLFSCQVPERYASSMRSSVMLLGPLLGRVGCADIAWPGGCSIGARPVDLHQMALKQMGVRFEAGEKSLFAETTKLHGAVITLPFPSVGATENVILAAVLADGVTILKNAAREPEIAALCSFLRCLGADISYIGESCIQIRGVSSLHGGEFTIPSDRIVMGTYLLAVLGTGGDVFLQGDCTQHLGTLKALAEEAGARLFMDKTGMRVVMKQPFSIPVCVVTAPYPGFPTDLQSQLLALMAVSGHVGYIEERIFESRFATAGELQKMGADIRICRQRAWVYGKQSLQGACVNAPDLRGGAALVLAGLFADGETQIGEIRHIKRGYQKLEEDLAGVSADICLSEA